MMKSMVVVLLGMLISHGSVWADTKCDTGDPYTQECHAQSLGTCWDMTVHPSYPAQSNPWVVGEACFKTTK